MRNQWGRKFSVSYTFLGNFNSYGLIAVMYSADVMFQGYPMSALLQLHQSIQSSTTSTAPEHTEYHGMLHFGAYISPNPTNFTDVIFLFFVRVQGTSIVKEYEGKGTCEARRRDFGGKSRARLPVW